MPLYQYECECTHEFENYKPISERGWSECPICGRRAKQVMATAPVSDWFKPHINEHFNGEPILVRSRGHMKELCLKYNKTSRALGDVRNITEI